MTTAQRRYEHATELRAYAARVDALELASHRHPEAPILAKRALAQEMRARANAIVRDLDGPDLAAVVFGTPVRAGERRATAEAPAVEIRRAPRVLRALPPGTAIRTFSRAA